MPGGWYVSVGYAHSGGQFQWCVSVDDLVMVDEWVAFVLPTRPPGNEHSLVEPVFTPPYFVDCRDFDVYAKDNWDLLDFFLWDCGCSFRFPI